MHDTIHSPGMRVYSGSQVTRFSRTKDTTRRHLTDALTPSRMASILKTVDQGDLAALLELNEEMEAKDGRIQAVVTTRRRALTALDWTIEPDPNGQEDLARMAADYVGGLLREMPTWPTTLEHLATAIGPNIAVVELIWARSELPPFGPELRATVDVPGHRLKGDPFNGQGVFVETDDEPLGVEVTPGKFVLYHPNERAGFPMRVTMTHAVAVPFLVKHFSRADWMAFSEIYGMPWRWVKCTDGVGTDDRDTAKEMIENLGSDTAAVFPEGCEPETLEVSGRGEVFKELGEWADATISILYLGQTLTTEIGDRGSFAAAKVHDNVRADLLLADIKHEARMIREQVIRPMCMLKFPGLPSLACPHFKRTLFERRDTDSERMDLDQINAARALGLPVDVDEAYDRLGLTKPEGYKPTTIGGTQV